MSSRDVLSVSPHDIRFKLSNDLDLGGVRGGDWDITRRVPFETTDKHRSIVQRFRDGLPWEETAVFTNSYAERFRNGERIRGASTAAELAAQYGTLVDALYASMKAKGFLERVDGRRVPLPKVHIGRDGDILLGNQGNHRLAIAKALNLPHILVEVHTRHAAFKGEYRKVQALELPSIPAMTTEEERLAYYRLTLERAKHGAVVELGAWLGASTAYIAAGIRDSGAPIKAHVYDRFVSKPAHAVKWRQWYKNEAAPPEPPTGPAFETFKENLGPLLAYIEPHPGEISRMSWNGGPISLLVTDAPKRVPEISKVLTEFAGAMQAGSIMAWQDFSYFASYDIPACLSRMSDHVEFVEGIYPGTTAIFRVTKPWTAEQVSTSALSIRNWTADEIEKTWDLWMERLPVDVRARFSCGAAMFLYDIGANDRGVKRLRAIIDAHPEQVLPKWRYFQEQRPDLVARYVRLFECIDEMAAAA